MRPVIFTYVATDPACPHPAKAVCYEIRPRKGGGTVLERLPAVMHGQTEAEARAKLSAFWDAQIATAESRKANAIATVAKRKANKEGASPPPAP